MIVKMPDRDYALNEKLPPIGRKVVSWPWGNTPSLTQWSLDALKKYELGTIIEDTIDGYPVVAQIQTHTWYGAHPDWPSKPHKGVSIFVPVKKNAEGKLVALRDPPDGWGVSAMGWWRDHEWRERHWREHYTGIPKLAVLVGTTAVGALAGPIGALAGLVAGLFIDSSIRGGPIFGDDPNANPDTTTTGKPAAPTGRGGSDQHTQAEWDDFFRRHPMWKNKKKPGKPAPPKPAAPGVSTSPSPDTLSQAANIIQQGAAAAQGVAGAVGDVANALGAHGDFGIGTVIPSQVSAKPASPTTHYVQEIDIKSGATFGPKYPIDSMPDARSAATFAAVKYFGGTGATQVAGNGTGSFQVDGTNRYIYTE